MKLYSKKIGHGPPILISHGLFGMSDNWLTIGRELAAAGFGIHLVDLRNHGRSPHAATHRYPDMCDDLMEYLAAEQLDTVHIIGHSMGGKLAMIFALLHPEKVDKMVIVDIAPSGYQNPDNSFHTTLIDRMLGIDLTVHKGRGSIRAQLEAELDDPRLAMFLAKNIGKAEGEEHFKWKLNLPVLKKYLRHLYIDLGELEIHAPSPITVLFIKGNNSDYYLQDHEPDREFFFPDSEVVGIDGAGHWVHSERPDEFTDLVTTFLT